MNENTIKVLNREGKVKEGKVLLFCKDKETEKMYVCYTFEEKNDDNLIVLASALKSNSDSYYMDILEETEWRKLIDYMKLTFNKDEELENNVYILGINDELTKDTIIVDRGHKTAAMREEIVFGLRQSYIEAIPKKAEINDLTDNFGFDPLRNFDENYKLSKEPIREDNEMDDYGMIDVSSEKNDVESDDYRLPEVKSKAETYELPKYSTGYSFESREEVKPDKSYRESFEEKYPEVEARRIEEEVPKYEETPKSKYDDGKDIAYETILETLQANNKLLEAIREALAKERNANK